MTGQSAEDREYLVLASGRSLPLPLHWCNQEFGLAGNCVEHASGDVVAVYDATTRTGAILSAIPQPFWTIIQPCLREDFFDRLVPDHVSSMEHAASNAAPRDGAA